MGGGRGAEQGEAGAAGRLNEKGLGCLRVCSCPQHEGTHELGWLQERAWSVYQPTPLAELRDREEATTPLVFCDTTNIPRCDFGGTFCPRTVGTRKGCVDLGLLVTFSLRRLPSRKAPRCACSISTKFRSMGQGGNVIPPCWSVGCHAHGFPRLGGE